MHAKILNTAAIWIFCMGSCFFAMFNNFLTALTAGWGVDMESAWTVIFQQKAHSAKAGNHLDLLYFQTFAVSDQVRMQKGISVENLSFHA